MSLLGCDYWTINQSLAPSRTPQRQTQDDEPGVNAVLNAGSNRPTQPRPRRACRARAEPAGVSARLSRANREPSAIPEHNRLRLAPGLEPASAARAQRQPLDRRASEGFTRA